MNIKILSNILKYSKPRFSFHNMVLKVYRPKLGKVLLM